MIGPTQEGDRLQCSPNTLCLANAEWLPLLIILLLTLAFFAPAIALAEEGFPASALLALDLLGHCTIVGRPWKDEVGQAQIIAINLDTHIFEGAADWRCDGIALGW